MAIVERAPVPARLAGLSEAEAALRLERGEGNAVPLDASRTYRRILLQNTFSFINTLLFAIVILLLILGLYSDALLTASLVVANVVVGVIQEARAKRQLDRIALLTRPSARVIRDGVERTIDPAGVVRGDLLAVGPGEQILVDGALVEAHEMTVDESLLTGESDLVAKRVGDVLHSGSFCMAGSGTYEAQRVGVESVAQRITAQARQFRDVETPLQREVGLVLRVMLVLVAALSLQVGIAYWHVVQLRETVQAAAVLVSLVPQGLSFMVTVNYAMAAVRMAGKGALIQRMNAVESTSNIDVLCLDKTGTLTSNQLEVAEIAPLAPLGVEELRRLLGDYGASTPAGNRTSRTLAEGCGGQERPVLDEVPFSSGRKWSALAFGDGAMRGLYVLGAPEVLAAALVPGTDIDGPVDAWTARGLRVLLFARRPDVPELRDGERNYRLPTELTPLALVALSDVLRPEARSTIERFSQAGIALKIISGDNPDTVAALARQAGLSPRLHAVAGTTLANLDDQALDTVAGDATVFGRVTPEQKAALVASLRRQGHYVAMIGDGVNDVPSLKQADLAVAMRSGSPVARSVADVVLLEDSFGALPAAFLEGQRIRKGMEDIIRLFLVRALYVALVIFGTALVGATFPITPKHNALLATLTVGIPVFALAAWARPGLTPRRLLLSGAGFVVPAAASIAAFGLVVYLFYLTLTGGDVEAARSALTTTTMICGLLLIPFAQPPNDAWVAANPLNGDWKPTVLSGVLLGVYVVVLAVPVLRNFYTLQVLPVTAYALIALAVVGWATTLRFAWRVDLLGHLRAAWRRLRARNVPSEPTRTQS
ncbi:MAG TPA: HAD-IC family P-type ATPase [Thermomicrobiaceae bacterium]|nr:HAD-IC family P-type ATPase [Thermomicrobiaceae bacterium]